MQVGVEEPATFRAVVTTAPARGLTGISVIRPGTSTAGVPGLTEFRAVGTEWQGVTSGHLTSATALRPATTRSRRAFGLRCHRSRGPRQCLAGRHAGVRAHDSDRRHGRPRELSCCDRTVPAHGRTPSKPRRARTNVGGGTARPQSTCWRHDRLTIGEGVSATLSARHLLASGQKGRRSATMDAFPRDARDASSRQSAERGEKGSEAVYRRGRGIAVGGLLALRPAGRDLRGCGGGRALARRVVRSARAQRPSPRLPRCRRVQPGGACAA